MRRYATLALTLFLAACSGGGESQNPVEGTPTPTSSQTPTATPTATPEPTPTGTPMACEYVPPTGFPTTAEGVATGKTARDIQVVDMDGNTHCLHDYLGKVVLLNAGSGWCPPCQSEAAGIQDVYSDKKDAGFVVLMTLMEDYSHGDPDPTFMNSWRNTYGITFPLIPDPSGTFWDTYVQPANAGYIPMNVLIDRDHVIRYSIAGGIPESTLRSKVDQYLNQAPLLNY